jgi:hypothetical protein
MAISDQLLSLSTDKNFAAKPIIFKLSEIFLWAKFILNIFRFRHEKKDKEDDPCLVITPESCPTLKQFHQNSITVPNLKTLVKSGFIKF